MLTNGGLARIVRILHTRCQASSDDKTLNLKRFLGGSKMRYDRAVDVGRGLLTLVCLLQPHVCPMLIVYR